MAIKRILYITVEREQTEEDVFVTAIASSLREYSSAIEKTATDDSYSNKNGAGSYENETFTATNGCKIKTMHKAESINFKA